MAAGIFLGLTGVASAQKITAQLKGKPAPAISLKTIDDKTINLPGPRGHVVLIDYWATWCGPCRAQLPHTQKLADDKTLAAGGLLVLAIDRQETPDKVKRFLEKNHYTFTVPMDVDHKFGEAYFVHGLPVTILIGRDGNIRNVFIGYGPKSDPKIDDAIADALKQPAP
jgi:thiol-disulfide isomerase/thioredoxin